MIPCRPIEIRTPGGLILDGLWFGAERPRRAVVLIHGLQSTAFSKLGIAAKLADRRTAILAFNNRGFGAVNKFSRIGTNRKREYIGGAHEKFADCVDDIEGAVRFARRRGARDVVLLGHSTGCQKAVYWAHKKGKGVRGIALLAPISDYTAGVKWYGKKKVERVVALARRMIRAGRGRELIPHSVWRSEQNDAERFLSLYTPTSVEQSVFPYFDEKASAHILKSVRIPILALLAEKDEFGDRPAHKIAEWFKRNAYRLEERIIKGASHGFTGRESIVVKIIRDWIERTSGRGPVSYA